MPCTFSHPLAVIPLHRLFPARFNFAALVAGSMSPDFAYYAGQFPVAQFAHTIPGTFLVCMPTGLLALGIFCALRQPLCFMLPQPHRTALTPLASVRKALSLRHVLLAAVSVLLGAWTHTIWDSFTHAGGWSVQHVSVLSAPLVRFGSIEFHTSYVLQLFSTFGGGAALAIMYLRWLRRQTIAVPHDSYSFTDGRRYLLFGALAFIALAIATPAACRMASHFDGLTAFRVFVFRAGVYSSAVFIPLLALASVILYAIHRRTSSH